MKRSKGLITKLLDNKLLVSSSFIAIASVFGGVINFLFNVIFSNKLPGEYGIIYPLASLSLIVLIPAKAVQFVLTQDISELIKHNKIGTLKVYFKKAFNINLIFSICIALVLLALTPLLKKFFHLTDMNAFLLIIIYVFISSINSPFFSMIQSRERFFMTGISQIISIVMKFSFGVGLLFITQHYFSALIAFLINSVFLILLFGIDYLRFKEIKDESVEAENEIELKKLLNTKKILKSFFHALISYGAFQLITYLDPILVRHYLVDDSGMYSTINVLGKASFFLATAFSFVVLPILAKDRENMHKNNMKGLFLLSLLLLLYAGALTVLSKPISLYIFGGKYVGMETILPLYAFMFLPYALISYLVNYYFISKNIIYSITILCGAVLQIIGVYFFHADLTQVSIVMGVVGYLVLSVLLIDSVFIKKPKQK